MAIKDNGIKDIITTPPPKPFGIDSSSIIRKAKAMKKNENAFTDKYVTENSTDAEEKLFGMLDEALETGETQTMNLENGEDLIFTPNEDGTIDAFYTGDLEKPLVSFDKNQEYDSKGGFLDLKGTANNNVELNEMDFSVDSVPNKIVNSLAESIEKNATPQQKNDLTNVLNEKLSGGDLNAVAGKIVQSLLDAIGKNTDNLDR